MNTFFKKLVLSCIVLTIPYSAAYACFAYARCYNCQKGNEKGFNVEATDDSGALHRWMGQGQLCPPVTDPLQVPTSVVPYQCPPKYFKYQIVPTPLMPKAQCPF